jgi:hypothetical protein
MGVRVELFSNYRQLPINSTLTLSYAPQIAQ